MWLHHYSLEMYQKMQSPHAKVCGCCRASSPAAACAAFRLQSWLWACLRGRRVACAVCRACTRPPRAPRLLLARLGGRAACPPSAQVALQGQPGSAGPSVAGPLIYAQRPGVHDPHCGPRASRDGLHHPRPHPCCRRGPPGILGAGGPRPLPSGGLLCRTPQVWEGRAGPGSTLGLPNTARPTHFCLVPRAQPRSLPASVFRHGSGPPVTSGA